MSSYAKKTIFNNVFNGMILLKFLRFPLNDSGYYEKYESLQEINQIGIKRNIYVENAGLKNKTMYL